MLGQWGIFSQTGAVVLQADSVFSVEYEHDYRVSDYPQEQGAFESYNKIQVPWQAKVVFLIGADRELFLVSVENAVASLSLFVVVTPEFSYPSANLTRVSYRRIAKAGGASMIMVEVWCEEVRIVQTGQLSNTQSTNGATSLNNGPVQTSTWQSSIAATPPT